MGNKLYREESIQAIANAIREKGVSGTFKVSQMASAIQNIPGVKTDTTGTFTTTKDRLLGMVIDGNSRQETRSGKNLLNNNIVSTVINGLTITRNEDGSILINGTATANVGLNVNYFKFENGKTYMMSGCPSGGKSSTYYMIHNLANWNTDYGDGVIVNGKGQTAAIVITIRNGVVCNNLLFKPMIEEGTAKTSYEQYGASPSPDYPSEVEVVKGYDNLIKNVQPEVVEKNGLTFTIQKDGSVIVNGTSTATSWYTLVSKKDYEDGDYFVYVKTTNNNLRLYMDYPVGYTTSSKVVTFSNYNQHDISLNVPSGVTLNNERIWFMLVKSSKALPYLPYGSIGVKNNDKLTYIDLKGNELCKIGDIEDTLDITTGVLTKRIGKVVLNGSEEWTNFDYDETTNYLQTFVEISNSKSPLENEIIALSNCFKGGYWNSYWVRNNEVFVGIGDRHNQLWFTPKGLGNLNAFKQWLQTNNVIVYYELATPETIQLDTHTITTNVGQNNIEVLAELEPSEMNIEYIG